MLKQIKECINLWVKGINILLQVITINQAVKAIKSITLFMHCMPSQKPWTKIRPAKNWDPESLEIASRGTFGVKYTYFHLMLSINRATNSISSWQKSLMTYNLLILYPQELMKLLIFGQTLYEDKTHFNQFYYFHFLSTVFRSNDWVLKTS